MDAEHETEQSSGYAEDTTEELLEQAQSNGQATIIATIAFLTEHRLPIADWIASLGRTFALAWDEPEPWDAGEFLDAMLTNFRSLGATVLASDLSPDRAEATTTGFPDPELCAIFGVDPALVAAFNDIPASLAADRSLSWEWFRTGEETRYSVRRLTTDG
ncbi:MAG TPA: hypothetical protein VKB09_14185 [Thermomicrobiales bacterium]|nr:hypothetical protein [Thermomicrobiales bacterium]